MNVIHGAPVFKHGAISDMVTAIDAHEMQSQVEVLVACSSGDSTSYESDDRE